MAGQGEGVGKRGRIAIVYDCAYPFVAGGGQKRLFEIALRLVQMGWAVDWYSLKSWADPGTVVVDGIKFVPVAQNVPLYNANGKRRIAETLYFGRAMMGFPQLRDYDVVHIGQWPYFHFFPIVAFTAFGRAHFSVDWWEVWGREWLSYFGAKGALGMALEWLCAHLPRRLVAISDIGAAQLQQLGLPASRIKTIHNGIDWARLSAGPVAATAGEIAYLGRLQPHKNVDLLIDAIGLLRDQGLVLGLSIIGDGPQREALASQVDRLGLQAQVKFHGAIADEVEVYGYLRAARLFVHPSTKEGGGSITSLEANAAGAQVIAFRCPAGLSPELIQTGVNGTWVEHVSADHLAEAIGDLWHKEDWSTARERARSFARRFDWDIIASQYDDFFRELTAAN